VQKQHEQPEGKRPAPPDKGQTSRMHPMQANQESNCRDPPQRNGWLQQAHVGQPVP
jgi:hypothetical protein